MTAVAPPVEVACATCRKTHKTKLTPAGRPRTPTGWHKRGEAAYCIDCWKAQYILRAVALPVAEPLGSSWEALRKELKALWRETTQASNWLMTELYARDVRRKPDQEKMPPMARQYFYPELRQRFPSLPPQTVVSLEQSCQKKYRAKRYQIIWTCAEALPAHRYPVPLAIHNQSWSVRIEQDKPIVRLRLGEVREVREVRLKTGAQFGRQYRAVRQLARGEAVPGEAALYQRGSAADARDGGVAAAGRRAGAQLMLEMVAWLPREGARERS